METNKFPNDPYRGIRHSKRECVFRSESEITDVAGLRKPRLHHFGSDSFDDLFPLLKYNHILAGLSLSLRLIKIPTSKRNMALHFQLP